MENEEDLALPWTHYNDSKDGKTNRHEIAGRGVTVARIYSTTPGDLVRACFILRAANNHHRLLRALKNLTDALYKAELIKEHVVAAVAAIAAAEGRL